MKNFFGKFFKTVAFLACLVVLLYLVSCIFGFKYEDGITPIDHFYDLPKDTVDVLLLGSSHMGMNVDPSLLWDLRGIAAYNCWGSMQQPWNTYYYLKECLKYQTPKLVVMDVYGVTFSGDFPGYDNLVKATQGLRLSGDKIENILVSAPEEYRSALLLGLPSYHYRYSEITGEDFHNFFWDKDTKIQSIDVSGAPVQSFDIPDVSGIKCSEPLAEKCETYFRKTLELCEEAEIPILLVASPYYIHEQEQRRFNRVGEIAEEYGVPFLNFNLNYRELGIDPNVDYCDLAHMTQGGIEKYTAYLADYMSSHYSLPDRRLDKSHVWNQQVQTESHCIYSLPYRFYGGGHDYLDTGVQLYENPYASYTILTEINTVCSSKDQVWFSCFHEGEDLRGVLLTRADGNLYVILNRSKRVEITAVGEKLRLAVVKEGLTYTVYVNGEKLRSETIDPFDPLDYTLMLGCQLNEEGKRYRYSATQVDQLEIYDIALDADAIARWAPAELPEPPQRQVQAVDSQAAFFLEQQFTGDGYSSYLDTGLDLYGEPNDSWTLLTQFREGCDRGAGVYFSCFAEEETDYRGVMARRVGPGQLNLLYGNRSVNFQVPEGSQVSLAIVKDESAYSIYLNGKQVVQQDYCDTNPWGGNLLLGCQETGEGEKMRFSAVTVYNFEVYHGVMEDTDILAWHPEHRPEPVAKQPAPVAYTLDRSFLGDGKSAYVDTGVQLYDVADKSWCLEMTFRKSGPGHLVTCFAEDPNSYRGLIVTALDDTTLSLTLGQAALELTLGPRPEQALKITKQAGDYAVWLNGEPAGQLHSDAPAYDGTLLIGCAADGSGKPFRFSHAKILSLTVTDQVT